MKLKIFFLALLFLIAHICTTCNAKNVKTADKIEKHGSIITLDGRVPNEETAISIAEAVWLPIYGRLIYDSKPFRAQLVDDSIWVVEGTLPKGSLGGTPYVEIQKSDGKILKVSHGQ